MVGSELCHSQCLRGRHTHPLIVNYLVLSEQLWSTKIVMIRKWWVVFLPRKASLISLPVIADLQAFRSQNCFNQSSKCGFCNKGVNLQSVRRGKCEVDGDLFTCRSEQNPHNLSVNGSRSSLALDHLACDQIPVSKHQLLEHQAESASSSPSKCSYDSPDVSMGCDVNELQTRGTTKAAILRVPTFLTTMLK